MRASLLGFHQGRFCRASAGVYLLAWCNAAAAQGTQEPAQEPQTRSVEQAPGPAKYEPQSLTGDGVRTSGLPSRRLDLQGAMRLGELQAPELREPQAERRGTEGLRAAARRMLQRPPRVEVSVGARRMSANPQLGPDATLGVFQEFSLGGYRDRLDAFASAATKRADANLTAARRDARIRAGLAWLDSRVAREILAIRRQGLEGAREVLRIADARVSVGRSSPSESALARALVGSAEAAVLSALGDISVADARLRHVSGLEPHQPLEIVGPIDREPLILDESALRRRVLALAPDLTASRAHATALERAANLGRAASRPYLEVGPSVTREATGDWIVLGNLSVPLPGIDPAAADNAVRSLDAQMARARVGVLEQATLRDVEVTLRERESALRLRNSLRDGAIEPSRRAVRETQLQYEVGRIDLTTVLAARRELLQALESWARAAGDVQRGDVRLQRWFVTGSSPEARR